MGESVNERKMMRKENSEISIEGDKFSDTMRAAQRAYRFKQWDKFKRILGDDKIYLLEDFDLLGNTAITMAARSDDPEILKEFLGKLSEEEKWRAFRRRNNQGNTILHEIAVSCEAVEMANIVLDFEKATPLPPELVAAEEEEEEDKRKPLLEWRNLKGETPVFKAAKFGNLKMLSHLLKHADNMRIHEESSGETILHASVNGQHFDVALWILMNMDKSSLVGKKNKNDLTCLQLLARMPRAFKSYYYKHQEPITKFIYGLLPSEGYEIEGCNSFDELLRPPLRDLETGGQDDARPPSQTGLLAKINYAVWKYLTSYKVFKVIKSMWEEKKQHELAERVGRFLVRCDYTWQLSYNERNEKPVVKLPLVLLNVPKRRQELRWKEKKKVMMGEEEEEEELERYKEYPALLVAASNGMEEIIGMYVEEHPESINHVSEDGQTILHVAVMHRQENILEWLEQQPELPSMASRVTRENRTALHQVARMDYYRGSSLAGAAFQLQQELHWYERVEKMVPSHLRLQCDDYRLTAGDLLDIEHDQMLADAQEWTKKTAESCSTVAVLVATVVFAAAYTIPGGVENGKAVYLKTPVFIFFTIMDIVALAFSLSSVVMFLSILNAPFELWDFHKSLPRKLRFGFAFLFLALTTTMLAFSATILFTIQFQWKQWTSTLVYGAAFFPVTIFALIEFPLFKKLWWFLSMLSKKKKTLMAPSSTRVKTKRA